MNKIVRPGHVKIDGEWATVYIRIKYSDSKLSFTGVEGPLRNGNALGSCGQINMSLKATEVHCAAGWSQATLQALLDVWDKWHLNDMRAGCMHQQARGETWGSNPGATCPSCGYVLGSAWVFEPVPYEIIHWLKMLPDSNSTPAWV